MKRISLKDRAFRPRPHFVRAHRKKVLREIVCITPYRRKLFLQGPLGLVLWLRSIAFASAITSVEPHFGHLFVRFMKGIA